jgi:hypothetical protein
LQFPRLPNQGFGSIAHPNLFIVVLEDRRVKFQDIDIGKGMESINQRPTRLKNIPTHLEDFTGSLCDCFSNSIGYIDDLPACNSLRTVFEKLAREIGESSLT